MEYCRSQFWVSQHQDVIVMRMRNVPQECVSVNPVGRVTGNPAWISMNASVNQAFVVLMHCAKTVLDRTVVNVISDIYLIIMENVLVSFKMKIFNYLN